MRSPRGRHDDLRVGNKFKLRGPTGGKASCGGKIKTMPNRIIKESIRTSRTVNSMTDFQFRVWLYLITYVDDYGRGSADPEIIKGFVFPRRRRITEADISKTLAELAGMGCICLYEVEGESYFYFPKWGEHQRIQTKKSKFPEPLSATAQPCSTVAHGESPPQSNPNPNPNTQSEAFDAFWAAYPKKVGKQAARKAFELIDPSLYPAILSAVSAQKECEQWTKENGRYIPNPATWLSQGRWEDETPDPAAACRQPGGHELESMARLRRLQNRREV